MAFRYRLMATQVPNSQDIEFRLIRYDVVYQVLPALAAVSGCDL